MINSYSPGGMVKNNAQTRMKMGRRIGIAYLTTYPKKLGIFKPFWSLIALTMKFGPFPMYVIAPKNTAPAEIAVTRRIDQARVDAYADAARDRNPIHLDTEVAASSPFGRPIAHGMLVLALVSEAMTEAFGERWAETGTLKVRWRAPALAARGLPGAVMTQPTRSMGAATSANRSSTIRSTDTPVNNASGSKINRCAKIGNAKSLMSSGNTNDRP